MRKNLIVATIVTAGLFLLAAAFPTWAADAAPPDPIKLTVSRQTLQLIGQGVMELPYKIAAPILNDMQAQLNAQDQAAKPKAAEPPPEPKD